MISPHWVPPYRAFLDEEMAFFQFLRAFHAPVRLFPPNLETCVAFTPQRFSFCPQAGRWVPLKVYAATPSMAFGAHVTALQIRFCFSVIMISLGASAAGIQPCDGIRNAHVCPKPIIIKLSFLYFCSRKMGKWTERFQKHKHRSERPARLRCIAHGQFGFEYVIFRMA